MTPFSNIEDFKLQKMFQLRNYVSDRRCILYGNHTISLSELERWLQDNSTILEKE